jgi:hypothetical protein
MVAPKICDHASPLVNRNSYSSAEIANHEARTSSFDPFTPIDFYPPCKNCERDYTEIVEVFGKNQQGRHADEKQRENSCHVGE